MKLRNIISAVAAAAVAASAASLCAFADDQPAGYVYFMAEKTTLGQGFVVEPVKVPYYEARQVSTSLREPLRSRPRTPATARSSPPSLITTTTMSCSPRPLQRFAQ